MHAGLGLTRADATSELIMPNNDMAPRADRRRSSYWAKVQRLRAIDQGDNLNIVNRGVGIIKVVVR